MEEFEIKDGVLIKYHEIEGKTSVVVPNSVTKIGNFAFRGCSNLIDIILLEGVTEIGFGSFMECIKLKNITFPKSLTTLDARAFQNCKNLTNIVLPENVMLIGCDVFMGCTSLTNITLPENILGIGYGTFVDCSKLNVNASEKTFDVLNYLDKYSIISNFVRQYYTNNIYTNEDIKRYKKFILLTKKELLQIIEERIQCAESIQQYTQPYMQKLGYRVKTKGEIIREQLSPIIKNTPLLYFMCNDYG